MGDKRGIFVNVCDEGNIRVIDLFTKEGSRDYVRMFGVSAALDEVDNSLKVVYRDYREGVDGLELYERFLMLMSIRESIIGLI